MDKYLQIGKIINTHGLKGEVKVFPLTDNLNRFDELKFVYCEESNTVEHSTISKSRTLTLEQVKYFKDKAILKFRGIDSIEEAEKLKNHFLVIHRDDAIKLPEHTYFVCDLIGCNVYDSDEQLLGTLHNVLKTGSNDVYIVKDEGGNELLIPALKSVVKSVLIEEKKIVVELPEGL